MPYADKTSDAARAANRRGHQKHYYANQEAQIARSRRWNDANPDKFKANRIACRRRKPLEEVLWHNASQRARVYGLPFDLKITDIVVPERCPILGFKLVINYKHAGPDSPSLDRIDPALGYVVGNIQVVSHKANTIKSNATTDELRKVLAFMEARERG